VTTLSSTSDGLYGGMSFYSATNVIIFPLLSSINHPSTDGLYSIPFSGGSETRLVSNIGVVWGCMVAGTHVFDPSEVTGDVYKKSI